MRPMSTSRPSRRRAPPADVSATSTSVAANVHAPAGVLFDLLATPHRHHEVDPAGMVGSDEEDSPITKIGQVFRMNMTHEAVDGVVDAYQVDNHVTAFVPNRLIAWAVAPTDGVVHGWSWRWELEPDGDDRTLVWLTYDWTDTPADDRARYGVPRFDALALTASVRLLESAVGDC